ncbi:hypothetical protein SARC_01678 [Sphaeroforma arctica JP610]|uniref:Uncharacterized protein n=1 Tax=Sphaeroforma arctica JP610 TaxID=667725 RepID=A0A0L0GAX0_9EUKA|nr:hypothetical protein SARC_01678 [Sphaeroforma arctica JP610]KNC86152.1 hypothetical protein SARC_01678 [Sphaeroforma arctica JP610]|eukprot:XP_014160054.1 hypothetical protein SARC_01678 [Sphaeroforma arctica JP610]
MHHHHLHPTLCGLCVSYLQEKLKRHPAPDAGTVVGFNGTPSRIPVRSPSRAPASSSGYGQIQRNADPSSATDLDGRHGNTTPTRGESLSFRSGPGVSSRGMSISPERSPYYTQPQATTPQSAKAYRNYAPTHNQPQPDLDAYDHPDSHSHPHVPPHRSVQESPFVHVHASKPIRMPPTPADRVAKKVTLEWDSPEDTLAHKGHFPDLAPTYMSSDDSSFILPTRHQADPKFGSVSAASLGMGRQRLGEDLYEDMDVDSHSLSPVRNLGQSALGYDSTISGASAAIDSTYTSTTYGYAHTNTDTQRISALNSGAGAGIKTDPHVAAPAPVQTHVAVLSYLATVGTESPTLAVKTLKECARSLKDHPERWGVPEFEELLQACSLHLSRINTAASANATALSDPAVSARLCRHTVHAIQQLYSDCKLSMRQVSSVVVEPLLLTVIEATTTHKHSREAYSDRDRREIAKALESLQPTIVRGHPPSVMLLSLMGSLNQTTRNADSKLVDKLSSFAIQLIRMLDAHDTQTIAWAPIFTAMNYFLTAFPVHSWQDRALWRYSEEDKPLRVVERLATLVVQHEGVASKKHVEGFAENAPVAVYMTHLLARTLGPSGPVNGHDILPGQTQSQPPRDNATTHTDPRAQQIHALPEVQVQTQEPQQKAISKEIADQVHAITSKLPSDLFEAGKKMAHIFIEHPEAESVLETNISHLSEHFQDYFRRDIRAHIDTLRNELGVPAPSDRLIITPLNSQVEEPQPTKSHHASLEFANTGTIVGLAGAHTRDRTTSAMNLDILGHGSTPLADVEQPPRSSAHISELAALLKTKVRSQAQDYPSARTSQAAGGASVYDTSYALNAALYDSNATQHGPLSAPVQSDLKATLKESLARQTNR